MGLASASKPTIRLELLAIESATVYLSWEFPFGGLHAPFDKSPSIEVDEDGVALAAGKRGC